MYSDVGLIGLQLNHSSNSAEKMELQRIGTKRVHYVSSSPGYTIFPTSCMEIFYLSSF